MDICIYIIYIIVKLNKLDSFEHVIITRRYNKNLCIVSIISEPYRRFFNFGAERLLRDYDLERAFNYIFL